MFPNPGIGVVLKNKENPAGKNSQILEDKNVRQRHNFRLQIEHRILHLTFITEIEANYYLT